MSLDDILTPDEKASGCVASDVWPEGVSREPDSYMAQDLENRFRSMFFKNGRYEQGAVVIRHIMVVGAIRKITRSTDLKKVNGFYFPIFILDGSRFEMEYKTEDEARRDRTKLIYQIEQMMGGST